MTAAEQKPKTELTSLVDHILATKKPGPKADVSALEAEIDQLVYSLYGLTPDEIRIVEESVEKKTPIREVADDSAVEEDQ